jgi:exosortase D (VPLPA-CTERM-specific)
MLRELRDRPPQAYTGSRWPGLAVIALGLGVGLVGNLSQIPDIITYGLLIAIAGLILLLAGPRQGMRLWAGWAFLLFMLPLPNMVYWELSTKLQLISSQAGVELIQAMRIPVYLDGNIIDLGSYKLQVAEACNGLRYLFPLMSFGFLFAVLYQGPFWHRIVLFLATIPITIAMNSFRIAVIGVLVNQFGIAQAEGFLHYFEGWIIFVACIVLLYFCAFVLQRLTAQPKPVLSVLDLRMGGIARPLNRLGHVPSSGWLVSAAVVLALSGALWQLTPARASQTVERWSFALFPMQVGEWDGASISLDPIIERVLGADDYLIADYKATGVRPVNLFVAYYESLTGGSWIHSPEICIPGGGWEVSRWTRTRIDLETPQPTSFEVNRAIIQKGEDRQLVYYWFEQQGRRLTSDYAAKFYTMWDAIVERRSDAALVRVITPLALSGGEAEADRRLRGFLESALPMLSKHVPD